MEPNSPKKIQFAVPLFQSQIDPEAAEQIRKRRPTPASLVIMTDSPPADQSNSKLPVPRQRKIQKPPQPYLQVPPGGWQPEPSARPAAHNLLAEEIDDKRMNNNSQAESQNASPKQRKQSVYTPPVMKGVKHLKNQTGSAFPEEDEGVSERDEEWSP